MAISDFQNTSLFAGMPGMLLGLLDRGDAIAEAVKQFGEDDGRDETLRQLSDVDHRITLLGEAVNDAIGVDDEDATVADAIIRKDVIIGGDGPTLTQRRRRSPPP